MGKHYVLLPEGATCACGCGQPIMQRRDNGTCRYVPVGQTMFFAHGHNPRGTGGPTHHLYKGGRIYNRGYVLLSMPDDPRADGKGYVPEHRVVWEEANGRALEAGEEVHHCNGIRDDNRPVNLRAFFKAAHAKEHDGGALPRYMATHPEHAREQGRKGAIARWGEQGSAKEERQCGACSKTFMAWRRHKRRFCSLACAGLAERHALYVCERCGIPFRDSPSAQRRFCSTRCSVQAYWATKRAQAAHDSALSNTAQTRK